MKTTAQETGKSKWMGQHEAIYDVTSCRKGLTVGILQKNKKKLGGGYDPKSPANYKHSNGMTIQKAGLRRLSGRLKQLMG